MYMCNVLVLYGCGYMYLPLGDMYIAYVLTITILKKDDSWVTSLYSCLSFGREEFKLYEFIQLIASIFEHIYWIYDQCLIGAKDFASD